MARAQPLVPDLPIPDLRQHPTAQHRRIPIRRHCLAPPSASPRASARGRRRRRGLGRCSCDAPRGQADRSRGFRRLAPWIPRRAIPPHPTPRRGRPARSRRPSHSHAPRWRPPSLLGHRRAARHELGTRSPTPARGASSRSAPLGGTGALGNSERRPCSRSRRRHRTLDQPAHPDGTPAFIARGRRRLRAFRTGNGCRVPWDRIPSSRRPGRSRGLATLFGHALRQQPQRRNRWR
mmetsp:Transcript_32403/g.104622  ORF Transcript_32403/g.104622 Transcript_32403/m.104622 type:complete len:235 (+) Transcript_32403:1044-1748(+)